LHFSTNNQISPSATEIRKAMGRDPNQHTGDLSTKLAEQEKAYESFTPEASAIDLKLKQFATHYSAPWNDVMDALKAGKGVCMQLNYGTINDQVPELSGSLDFRGGHSVFLVLDKNPNFIRMYDGLCDGRTRVVNGKKVTYPRGPQKYPIYAIRKAAQTYCGKDGCATFGVVTRAEEIAVPKPKPPTDVEKLRERVKKLEGDVAALEDALNAVRGAILGIEDAVQDAIAVVDTEIDHEAPTSGATDN
jgi:hypothetical protein